jgi:signal peptidase
VREVPFQQIAVGDVIQFESRGASIWHRVIEVQQRGVRKALITKGDANNGPDVDAVYAENYSGKVVWKIPKLGIITIKLRDLMSQAK